MKLTPDNVDDRAAVPELVRGLFGKLIGDKGYISQPLFEELFCRANLQLITGIRSNMQNKLMPIFDKILLRKRSIIETIFDQLKNISQIEHSRHRSHTNFLVSLACGRSHCLFSSAQEAFSRLSLPFLCSTNSD